MDDVIQTLATKINDIKSAIYEANRSESLKDDATVKDLLKELEYPLYDSKCLVDTIAEKKKRILPCANWLLARMQYGFYYDEHEAILSAEDEGHFHLGEINRAITILIACGIISRRIIKDKNTIYLVDSFHKWIVSDFEQETTIRK